MDFEHAKADMRNIKPSCPIQVVSEHFRAQPIVEADSSLKVKGLELLHRKRLNYADANAMLEVDIKALENAAILAREYGSDWRIHCNVEITSLIHPRWIDAMIGNICPAVVVELVERNHSLSDDRILHQVHLMVEAIRKYGGTIALDDVTGTPIELAAILEMQPEIIKVEDTRRIDYLKGWGASKLVIERIETPAQAAHAKSLGVDELQGYWCDVAKSSEIPDELTPPGIAFYASQEILCKVA